VRVLLDSSVLIAAYISRAGVCADLLEDVLMDHELVISDFIVGEFARKLQEKFHFPDDEIAEVRNSLLAAAQCVEPVDVPEGTCRDPNDLPVLGTAVAGHAEVLVTGDKDLLTLGAFEGVSIVRPGDFWGLVE
jgi:putative PIN family toxin of toxin-antitoxin system